MQARVASNLPEPFGFSNHSGESSRGNKLRDRWAGADMTYVPLKSAVQRSCDFHKCSVAIAPNSATRFDGRMALLWSLFDTHLRRNSPTIAGPLANKR